MSINTLFSSIEFQISLNDFYWIKAITHLQLLVPRDDHIRENIRTYVGEYPSDPINPLFPSKLCHTTEHWVMVPVKSRYNCNQTLYGKYIFMDQYGKQLIIAN